MKVAVLSPTLVFSICLLKGISVTELVNGVTSTAAAARIILPIDVYLISYFSLVLLMLVSLSEFHVNKTPEPFCLLPYREIIAELEGLRAEHCRRA